MAFVKALLACSFMAVSACGQAQPPVNDDPAVKTTAAMSAPALTPEVPARDVLIRSVPTYTSGESSSGEGFLQDGTRVQLQQSATRGNGRTIVSVRVLDEQSNEIARMTYDPVTWRAEFGSGIESGGTSGGTCSSRNFFPVYLGMSYECTTAYEVNGEQFSSTSRLLVDQVHRNQQGQVTEICALSTEQGDEFAGSGRICVSPDGKWIRSYRILEYESRI